MQQSDTILIKQQFYSWLKEIVRWGKLEDFIHWSEETYNKKFYKARCNIYTHDYIYSISVHVTADQRIKESDKLEKYITHDYLGCTVSTRKPRAGEDWNRGNDLPDGKFNKETWEQIKNSIVRHELVKICKPVRRIPDTIENNK